MPMIDTHPDGDLNLDLGGPCSKDAECPYCGAHQPGAEDICISYGDGGQYFRDVEWSCDECGKPFGVTALQQTVYLTNKR